MRSILALLFLLACSTAHAQEFSVWQGKGVNHWPNNDNTMLMMRGDATERFGLKFYTEGGLGISSVVSSTYGRAFTSFHLGRQVEYQRGMFFANASLGGAIVSRTADGPEYALAPYGSFFVGVRHSGISAALGHWAIYKPNLHSQWPCDVAGCDAGIERDRRYPTAAFTGFRIGIDLDVKRGK